MSLLAVLVLAFAGCGDDDSEDSPTTSSPEAYFTELEAIFQESSAAVSEAEGDLEAAVADAASLEEKVAVSSDYLADIEQIFRDTAEQMEELDPPQAAASYHDDFTNAMRDAADLSQELHDDLDAVTMESELDKLLDTFDRDAGATLGAADLACSGLQQAAHAAGVEVDLDCGS
jgi:hypothetical protein